MICENCGWPLAACDCGLHGDDCPARLTTVDEECTCKPRSETRAADCKHQAARYWEPNMRGYFCAGCGQNIEVTTVMTSGSTP